MRLLGLGQWQLAAALFPPFLALPVNLTCPLYLHAAPVTTSDDLQQLLAP